MNGLNQYSSVGGTTQTYDDNGNLTGDGTKTYTYDIENRLVKAVAGSTTTNVVYDPLGRLFEFNQGSMSNTRRFVTDGDAIVNELNGSNALAERFVHGSNAAADDPLLWYANANAGLASKQWLHSDHLGSIVARTASDGSGGNPVINKYDEYGAPATTNGGRFQYTGQVWISQLGLYYYKARFYSPALGRFMQTDPVGYDAGANLHAYVANDPINATDPTGEIILLQGTELERGLLKTAILSVGGADPLLHGRLYTLLQSPFTHTISFGRTLPEHSGVTTHTSPPFASHLGSNTQVKIDYSFESGKDALGRDLKTIMAHELFGHSYDWDRGIGDDSPDPKRPGLTIEEENGMAAQNRFNRAVGRPANRTYEGKSLPETSILGGMLTGNAAKGSRIGCNQKETNVC